nr:MAG TPA: hypothetical protein [Caudoviricetes sp.]
MMTKKIRVLTDLLDHLQRDHLDMMRQVEERTEQVSLVSDLLRAAAMVHEAEDDDEPEERDETDLSPEELKGVFRAMGKDFMDFWAETHKDRADEREDDDHDED